jgi:hypothetical protein
MILGVVIDAQGRKRRSIDMVDALGCRI